MPDTRVKSDNLNTDVIIVGCGPVGATLSLLLAKTGVSSIILEREKCPYPLPRAVHFDDQIMRVFQSIGIADDLEKVARYNPGMRFVDPQGNLLLDWPRPTGIGDNGWYSSYRFHQPDLEQLLRAQLEKNPYTHLRTYVEALEVEQSADSCSVSLINRDTEYEERLTSRFVVGCDGANSLVKRFISEDVDDLGFNEQWIVVDVLLNKDMPELGDFTIQHCGGERPSTYVRGPGNRRRWEISLIDSDDVNAIASEAGIWEILSSWITPADASIERYALYEFKSTIARQWRNNRLFIAGDAAHLTPPFMGQGMCAGIRDVCNLAWKLALCARQSQSDVALTELLLESYQNEREPNVKEYIKTAIGLGVLLNSCSTKESLKEAFPNTDGVVQMQSIVPKLGAGLLAGSDRLQGEWFPQPTLADGRRLDDMSQYRPVILIRSSLWQEFMDSMASLETDVLIIHADDEPEIETLLKTLNTQALLLRPDFYIMGSASNQTEFQAMLVTSSVLFGE